MNYGLKYFKTATFLVAILGQLGSCANVTENGSCKLSCPNRVIGGAGTAVEALSSDVKWTDCSASAPARVVKYQFLVFEPSSQTPAGATASGDLPKRILKAGVAFTPDIPGFEIKTATSDWCTDSCGVANFEAALTCVGTDVQVGINVPGSTNDAGGATKSRVQLTITPKS